MLFVSMLDFIGYAPIFVDFSGRFNNRAIRMIEYLSNTGSPLASKSFGLIRCYSGECGYVAILFSQLSHRHILLQIHPFAKIFTEVTSPKSCASANSAIPAYERQNYLSLFYCPLFLHGEEPRRSITLDPHL